MSQNDIPSGPNFKRFVRKKSHPLSQQSQSSNQRKGIDRFKEHPIEIDERDFQLMTEDRNDSEPEFTDEAPAKVTRRGRK